MSRDWGYFVSYEKHLADEDMTLSEMAYCFGVNEFQRHPDSRTSSQEKLESIVVAPEIEETEN